MLNIPLPARARPRRGAFSQRLAFAFAAVAALTALLAAVVLWVVSDYQFKQYVESNLDSLATQTAGILGNSYLAQGQISQSAGSSLIQIAMMYNLGIRVIDAGGATVFDSGEALQAYHQQLGVESPRTGDTAAFTVSKPISVRGVRLATLKVWTYGSSSMLSERDVRFRRGSLTGLTIAALLAMALASAAGLMYARALVRPIERITRTAESLRSGDHGARTGMGEDDEIHLLGKTLDEMADAIEADRELERRLTADVAHELRTPLQAIQATVEAMQDGVLPTDEERLTTVRDETVRLARLADGILELTRLERGVTPMHMERLDLAAPVRAAADALRALYESRDIVLSLDITENVHVLGDADRLQQAVSNLLSNAARYTPEGGRVVVALRREGPQSVVEVTDSGIGIAEEDLERVFQRFWRASQARDRASGGLGIGLAVVKEIVERHGGSVRASRRPQGGSTFTLSLPAA